jgi:serpin B
MIRQSIQYIYKSLSFAVLLSILSACAGPGVGGTGPIRSVVEREESPQVEEGVMSELAAGNRAFSFDLYQALRSEDGNLFFSPYSISAALAMTYAGARGNTEEQMAETLHYTLSQEQLHTTFNALDQALVSQADEDGENFTLRIANSLWGQEGFPFKQDFVDTLAKNYGAGIRLVDYQDDAKREGARQAINEWVNEETQGKIEELIAEGVLNELTRLVLANAIYFKGEWELPFLDGTKDAPFTLLDGSQVQVPTMSRRGQTLFTEGEDYQAVFLSYKGRRAAMLILLPRVGQFESFERSLDAQRVDDILGQLQSQDVMLFLPKFEFSSEYALGDTLAAMGMPDAFDPQNADFTAMIDSNQVDENLFISQVVHKAFVAVDEIGTEAAAATGVVVGITSMPHEVRIDRPFIFVIYDQETNTDLFVGRVLDPR